MKNTLYKLIYTNCILLITLICSPDAQGQALKEQNEIILAYYGRPGVSSLGVLGQHSPTELLDLIKAEAKEYAKEVPGTKILPAFNIIYGLAAAEPMADGSYIIDLAHHKLEPYLELAKENKCLVFLDLQLGNRTPLESVKPLLPYLKLQNVHLAIDPEFEVKGLGKRPGKVIGHIQGDDVNQVQMAMRQYMTENNVSEEKYLIVHNFTHKMVENKQVVKDVEGINLIMNLDGHGSPQLKVNTYNGLYTSTAAKRVSGGFKLFFKEDHPMMTPRQVLGLESVSGVRMREMPRYINYQ